jgi:quercetin dioxygenase-like cupin family protein
MPPVREATVRRTDVGEVRTGDGWAAAHLDDLGEGPGFRKVRSALGVEAFGVNAIVLPPAYATPRHYHERQQELYLVLRGEVEFTLGDGEAVTLSEGGLIRVDAPTVRAARNTSSDADAMFICVGGEGGYVGRDGHRPDDEGPAAPG